MHITASRKFCQISFSQWTVTHMQYLNIKYELIKSKLMIVILIEILYLILNDVEDMIIIHSKALNNIELKSIIMYKYNFNYLNELQKSRLTYFYLFYFLTILKLQFLIFLVLVYPVVVFVVIVYKTIFTTFKFCINSMF